MDVEETSLWSSPRCALRRSDSVSCGVLHGEEEEELRGDEGLDMLDLVPT